ncbi:MAG: hypothetical protein ABSF56_01685 [Minisyncoccia bacterium]|jgi:pimeloyl-ACP methyl ester carboxylesterase
MGKIRKVLLIISLGIIELFAVVSLSPVAARAETRVGGVISTDTVWSADKSPYLLTADLTVPDGVALTIGHGVSVGLAPGADAGDIDSDPALYVSGGRLLIEGTGKDRVSISDIGGVIVAGGSTDNGSADIADADLSGGTGISFRDSRGSLATTTISGAFQGIYMKDSIVSVWGSRIKGNETGIFVQPHRVFLVVNDQDSRRRTELSDRFGTGGIGNALADAPDLYASSSLTIRGTSFGGNASRSIYNGADFTVDAVGNWWGSPTGPTAAGADSVRGPVSYSPWLTAEPPLDTGPDDAPCCSSILFIPGLESTRLYRPESRPFGLGTAVNRLWEPNDNADVTKLYLNRYGSSTDASIYSGGPIDKALGLFGIYGRFMGFLDDLVRKGTVNEWQAFGYDWRKPVSEVVAGKEKKATTTESLVETVAKLASRSKTGKVSIVAHSNGGLVAEYLVKTLADLGKAGLIDSVISVGVPYLGTPAAIPALLHGDGESVGYGLIMAQANARGLGANMPSAYSLLPSREFFSKVFSPTIVFASTTVPDLNDGSYPQSIGSFEAQSAFISGTANSRKAPAASNTATPIKGNQLLMATADALHGLLDPFAWPTSIARWAIVGWNDKNTPVGIGYSNKGYRVIRDPYGDGTVMAQSAEFNSGRVIPVDLAAASHLDGKNINHSNILEASNTETAIGSMISNPSRSGDRIYNDNPAEHNTKVLNELSKIPGVSVNDMDWNHLAAEYEASRKELRVSTHSPVKLNVYDSHGNHTGEVPLPPEVASQVEEGLYTMKEEKIPGSSYDVLGCGSDNDCNTSIAVPDDGEKYTVTLDGVGTGSFTLDIERVRATTTVETVEWNGVPVTQLSAATTTIVSYAGFNAPKAGLASSTAPLSLDIDGDGTIDATSSPGPSFDQDKALDLLKKSCDAAGHGSQRCKDISSRIDRIRESMKSLRFLSAHASDWRLPLAGSGHLRFKMLTPSDRNHLLDSLDDFLKRFEH